jgi:hypothetical protein
LACVLSAFAGASGCGTPVSTETDAAVGPLDAESPSLEDAGSTRPDSAFAPDATALALRITSADRIHGTLEQPIELALTAEGGTPPYSWLLNPATLLPVGFSFSSDGVLRGTPHASGHFPFAVSVSDTGGRTASATLEVLVAEPILNDLCLAATPLDLSTGATTVLASLDGATANGVAAACQLSPALPDVFYSFELGVSSKVAVLATQGAAAVFPAECASAAAPIGCSAAFNELLPPGSYILAIAGGASDFRLDVKATPLLGDACGDIIPLDLSSGQAVVSGNFQDAKADLPSSCGYSSADRVYSFELAADMDVRVRDTGGASTSKAIRAGTCPGTAELGCTEGYSELSLLNVKAGKYVLVLKTPYSSSTDFTVTLSTSGPTLPPANDACAGATALTLVNDTTTMSGPLLGSTYDPVTPTCGGTLGDVYFSLDLPSTSLLIIDRGSYGSETQVQVLSGTCGHLVAQGCSDTFSDPYCKAGLPAGKYYLRVSSYYSQGGTFSYTVSRKDPATAPANDTCTAPATLTFKAGAATVSGELAAAPSDYVLPCSGSSSSQLHDVVYTFNLAARSDVEISATSVDYTGLRVGLVSDSCETGKFLACTADTSYRALQLWGLEPGDYWVVVEGSNGYSGSDCWAGKFTLSAKASASPPAPANDGCASPTEYTFAGPGTATLISGTTRGAANDFAKVSCNSPLLDGPDVVYALTLTASARLRVSASTAVSGMFFYLTSACGSTAALACSPQYSSTQEFVTNSLPAGTYYLVVDYGESYGRSAAIDFTLVVDTL